MKKLVLDTNVLVSNPHSVFSFTEENTEVIITVTTLDELDHLKKRPDVSRDARIAIRLISEIVSGHNYEDISVNGIKLNLTNKSLPDTVTLRIVDYKGIEVFDLSKQDAKIIATCKQEGAVLVTRDVNMRLLALSTGCEVMEYTGDDSVKDSDILSTGHIQVQPQFWETLESVVYEGKTAIIPISEFPEDIELYPNVYLYEKDEDGVDTIIGQVLSEAGDNVYVRPISQKELMNKKMWKVLEPRDILQGMCIDSILNPNMDAVTLIGGAGSGKTVIAISAALHLINDKKFKNMIYVKADSGIGQELGFLPGSLLEKLGPSLGSAFDALHFLHRNDAKPQESIEYLMDKGIIEFPSLHYFRGRSFGGGKGSGSVIILDEAQNLSLRDMKSIASRVGENSLLIILGNTGQIDNPRVNALNNGLVYASEKFKPYEHASTVILSQIYRSRLAGFIEDNF